MRYAFPMLTRLQRAGGWLLVALGLGAGLARAGDAPAGSTAAVAVVSVGHLGFKFSERAAATAAVPKVALLPASLGDEYLLPRMVVREHSLQLLDREVLTERGRAEFAEKRYITPLYRATFGPASQLAAYYFNPLAIFGGWHPNAEEAKTLYREDERVETLHELDELVKLDAEGKDVPAEDLKELHREVRQAGVDALYWNPSVLFHK